MLCSVHAAECNYTVHMCSLCVALADCSDVFTAPRSLHAIMAAVTPSMLPNRRCLGTSL